jgi:hypothetical protein
LVDLQTLRDLQGEFLKLKKQALSQINSQGKKEVISVAEAGGLES